MKTVFFLLLLCSAGCATTVKQIEGTACTLEKDRPICVEDNVMVCAGGEWRIDKNCSEMGMICVKDTGTSSCKSRDY